MSTYNPRVTSVLASGETTGWFILDTQLFKSAGRPLDFKSIPTGTEFKNMGKHLFSVKF